MSRPRKVALWAGAAAGVLALLVAALLLALESQAGRRILADYVAGLESASGISVRAGKIEGSLFGETILRDVAVRDRKGTFLVSPEVRVDWRPRALLRGHLDIRSAKAPLVTMLRQPVFAKTPPEDPFLPDIDIDVAAFRIDRFVAQPAVSGARQVLTFSGTMRIADRRAQVKLDGRTLEGGRAGGDRLALLLDAVPDDNRLAIDLDLTAPGDGLVSALTGIEAPLRVTVKGKGDWASWQGAIAADMNGTELARLALAARGGTFTLRGPVRAARLLDARPAALLGPVLDVDLTGRLSRRRADLTGSFTSEALSGDAAGIVDLSENRFEDFRLALDLRRPGALADGLAAQGLKVNLVANGAFAQSDVAYSLMAERIAINDIALVNLRARGKARIADGRVTIPVSAQADRITGLDAVAGGTLAAVRLDGDILADGSRLLSDNMRLRSDRIDAKLLLVADLSAGRYAGAIDGRIDRFRVESVGIFQLDTDVKIETQGRGLALAGRLRARSVSLVNEALRDFLGGNLVAAADVRYGPDSIARFANLTMRSPALRIDKGQGSFSPDGRLDMTAQGLSNAYGPVGVEVSGTLANLDARVTATRPGLGLGLANLKASITGSATGYRLDARADSDFGPVTAEVLLSGGKPLTLEISRGDLGGIGFSGTLRQSAGGPFIGRLDASGRGLGGVVLLEAEGRRQVAVIALRARNTVLPGPARLAVGSAIVDARVVLGGQPHVLADAQISGTRFGETRINTARLKIDYRDGRGTAQVVAEGENAVPFRIAVNADLQPDLWRAAISGRAGGVTFRTAEPARIRPAGGRYDLMPTRFEIGKGGLHLSGSYGERISLRGRLESVDLALADAISPGLGLSGLASGTMDFTSGRGSALPQGDANLRIEGFRRSTADAVSLPLDVSLVGKMTSAAGEVRAVLRSRGSLMGRVAATLSPIPAGPAKWSDRLFAAPLAGGIRYNGPADTLVSFAGLAGQRLTGPIAVGADFSGQLQSPRLAGFVRGEGLTYDNLTYGTRLTSMALTGRFSGDRLQIESLSARAGDGAIQARGHVSLSAEAGYPMDLSLDLDNARMARSDALSARASGSFRLTKAAGETALLSGNVRVPEARYAFVRQGAAQVPSLSGVRFKPGAVRTVAPNREAVARRRGAFDHIRLDIGVAAPERLFVSGMGLESEWRANLRLTGTTAAPRVAGQATLSRGTLDFAGRSFSLSEGRISFADGVASDPAVILVASEDIDDITVRVNVTGRASDPQVTFSSTPSLPQDEVLSRILFGQAIGNLSAVQSLQLAASLNSLRTGGAGLNPLGKLRSATGLDRLSILAADEATGRGTSLSVGQYITNDIYVEFITDARGFTATQIEVSLTKALSIISQAGGSGATDVNLRYRKNY